MVVRLHSFVGQGILLRGSVRERVRASVAYREILSAERLQSGRGFRLHTRGWESLVVLTRRRDRREAERGLRDSGVLIVDQYGARIDESQFEKEADPEFNTRFEENVWSLFRASCGALWSQCRRSMRQWSDGEGK
jgi:hypothetical protein